MKKQTHLPDFSVLCPPEQRLIQDIVSLYVFFFFAASIGGYAWEVLIFLVKDGTFTNRGFLYGPWLPVYGVGAALFYMLLAPQPFALETVSRKTKKSRPAVVFLLSALLGSGVELAVGWLLDAVWQLRYWDYTGYFVNFRGYVCAASALGFGIAGVVWICALAPWLKKLWFLLPSGFRKRGNTLLFFLFLTDCAAALIVPNIGRGITF